MVGIAVGAVLTVNLVAMRSDGEPVKASASRVYVVKPGDTVWSIVRTHSSPHDDPRPLVDRLIRVNRLRGAVILPGQRLVLPS